MSEEHELVEAMKEQAAATRQFNQIKAAEISYHDQEQKRIAKVNLRLNVANQAIKLRANRPMQEVIADAERLLEWVNREVAE